MPTDVVDSAIKSQATPKKPCPLAELFQYDCHLRSTPVGRGTETTINCEPVSRIFRLCPGRPSVEVTHQVKFNDLGQAYEEP